MVGIDRLALSFPLTSFEQDPSAWDQHGERFSDGVRVGQNYSATVEVGGCSVFVGAAIVNGEPWGKVEGNPARIEDPDGYSLLPVAGLRDSALVLLEAVGSRMAIAGEVKEARVKRLDVARDFEVEDPAFYVRGLSGVHRPYARRVGIWSHPGNGAAQTLHAGSGAGMVRLYDQHEAYAGKGAPEGAMRWEVEARSDWLSSIGRVQRLGDLGHDQVVNVVRDRWEWSAMGVEVAATDRVLGKVLAAERAGIITHRERRPFLGWLLEQSVGVEAPIGRTQQAKYRRWVREMGIALDGSGSAGLTGRLDLDSGREVLRAA